MAGLGWGQGGAEAGEGGSGAHVSDFDAIYQAGPAHRDVRLAGRGHRCTGKIRDHEAVARQAQSPHDCRGSLFVSTIGQTLGSGEDNDKAVVPIGHRVIGGMPCLQTCW